MNTPSVNTPLVNTPLIVAFHTPQLCIRGTSVALYDYAKYNELLLGNKSIIFIPEEGIEKSDHLGMTKFLTRFKIIFYKDNFETLLKQENCSLLYCIKYGTNDNVFSKTVKTVVHCVFDMSQPHGDIYAGVSKELAKKFSSSVWVPHMISLPDIETRKKNNSFRKKLNIPCSGIVFGRHGGMDTFNLPYVWEIIKKILNTRQDIYFIFINTPRGIEHERVFYPPCITTENEKCDFIDSLDAHLECGTLGHSFGLSIGEASMRNVPVIAFKNDSIWNTAHFEILKDKGIYFSTPNQLYRILYNFKNITGGDKDWNCYRDYTPKKVMEIFKKVFID